MYGPKIQINVPLRPQKGGDLIRAKEPINNNDRSGKCFQFLIPEEPPRQPLRLARSITVSAVLMQTLEDFVGGSLTTMTSQTKRK